MFTYSITKTGLEPVSRKAAVFIEQNYCCWFSYCSGRGTRTPEAYALAYEASQIPTSDIPQCISFNELQKNGKQFYRVKRKFDE